MKDMKKSGGKPIVTPAMYTDKSSGSVSRPSTKPIITPIQKKSTRGTR